MKFEAVTIKHIAQELGLSTSTVSRALRDSHEISQATKKMVLDHAKKVGFKNIPKPIYDRIKNSSMFPKDATVQESFKRFR